MDQWMDRLATLPALERTRLGWVRRRRPWVAVVSSFDELGRVLVGFIEATVQSAWSDELRQELAAHYRDARGQAARVQSLWGCRR